MGEMGRTPEGTVDGEMDPRTVPKVGVGAVPVEEQHPALVPALVGGAQGGDAQGGSALDPHTTCVGRGGML